MPCPTLYFEYLVFSSWWNTTGGFRKWDLAHGDNEGQALWFHPAPTSTPSPPQAALCPLYRLLCQRFCHTMTQNSERVVISHVYVSFFGFSWKKILRVLLEVSWPTRKWIYSHRHSQIVDICKIHIWKAAQTQVVHTSWNGCVSEASIPFLHFYPLFLLFRELRG